jgi:hypothetical protein
MTTKKELREYNLAKRRHVEDKNLPCHWDRIKNQFIFYCYAAQYVGRVIFYIMGLALITYFETTTNWWLSGNFLILSMFYLLLSYEPHGGKEIIFVFKENAGYEWKSWLEVVVLRTGEKKHETISPVVEDKFNELMLGSESTARAKSKFKIFGIWLSRRSEWRAIKKISC